MNILASIEEKVKGYFGELFENIEDFYLKNFLILVQGILSKKYGSISAIARNSLNNTAHTTLTRFLKVYPSFWKEIQILLRESLNLKTNSKRVLIIDDTLIERRGKQIAYTSKQFDHCQNRYTRGQVVLTIGEILDSLFHPLEMMFAGSPKKKSHQTKNEMVISWMKTNEIRDVIVVADSWYTNAPIMESSHIQQHNTFIGQLKSNLLLKRHESNEAFFKVRELIQTSKMNRKTKIRGKTIQYRSWLIQLKSVRFPVKVVVTELEDGSRAALVSTDTKLSSEEIIDYYALRWSIESFFKLVKQNFSFSNCHIPLSDAQNHFMLLVSVVYLIFNDLKKRLSNVQSNCPNPVFFEAVDTALSILSVIKDKCVIVLSLQSSSFLSQYPSFIQPLLHPLLLSCTS